MKGRITLAFAVLLCVSCSVKEQRRKCPAELLVSIKEQQGLPFVNDSAYIYIYDTRNKLLADKTIAITHTDADTATFVIFPRQELMVLTSSFPQENGYASLAGSNDSRLIISRKSCNLSGDLQNCKIEFFDKHYVELQVRLNDISKAFASDLSVIISSPYTGSTLPMLEPQNGRVEFESDFDEQGECVICLPRQSGPGMTLTLADKNGKFKSTIDLYGHMVEHGYNFSMEDLWGFVIQLSVNIANCKIDVDDWKNVDLGKNEF